MMAADPKSDRLRLIIESDDESGEPRDADAERARQRRPEDMIDLDRLDAGLDETVTDYEAVDYEYEDEEPPARRRLLPAAMAVIALLSFGSIAWYAYETEFAGSMNEAIPLIQADASPIKTRPAAPGGLEVPHQDQLVLNQLAPDPDKPQVERLLPPPEVPKPPVAPVVEAPQSPAPSGGLAAADSQAAETQPMADVAANTAGDSAPGTGVQTGLAPAAGPEPQMAEPQPAAAPVAAKAEPAPAAPVTAPAPSQATQSAALETGYMVQLASLKNKDLVGGEWLRLQQAFPTLLAGKKLVLQDADLGSRGTFHRVRAGYFPDQASAAATCEAFKAKNQACIVVRP